MEYTVDEVYGLSRNIPLNYVERHDVDERLRCNLNRDKHITIFGSSKQGKTCLRKHCLNENDYILVQCSNRWSLSDLNANILKRAGLDYWDKLDVTVYDDYADFLEKNPGAKIYMATTKAQKTYCDVSYEYDCYIMFGKESAGIPEEILVDNEETCIRIPMIGDIRSLNLSNSVAIVLYEALRQHNFETMNLEGHLHRLHWKSE